MSGTRLVIAIVVSLCVGAVIVQSLRPVAAGNSRYFRSRSVVVDPDDAHTTTRQYHITDRDHTNSALAIASSPTSVTHYNDEGDGRYAPNVFQYNQFPEFQLPFDLRSCKFIYLDLGTNEGYQIAKLFYGVKPNSKWAKKFNRYFGTDVSARRRDVCAIGAEPDTLHTPTLDAMEKNLTALGVRIKILRNPIWVNNDVLTFHSIFDKHNNHDASTLSTTHTIVDVSTGKRIKPPNVTKLELRGYRLSTLLAQIPNGTIVLAKLDIEGAEHRVLSDIILDGTICAIHFFGIEAHRQLMKDDRTELSVEPKQLNRFLERSRRCPVWAREFDDEA